MNVTPGIWYFSHTLAKPTSQSENQAFYENVLRDISETFSLLILGDINARNYFLWKLRNFLRDVCDILVSDIWHLSIVTSAVVFSMLKVKKCWHHMFKLTSLIPLWQGNVKKSQWNFNFKDVTYDNIKKVTKNQFFRVSFYL